MKTKRIQAIQSLTVQETIINSLNAERFSLENKINWLIGEEKEEAKARIQSLDRALAYAYKI